MDPVPTWELAANEYAKATCWVHTSSTITVPRESGAEADSPQAEAHEERGQRRADGLTLPRINSCPKRDEQQKRCRHELHDKGVGRRHEVRKQPTASDLEIRGPVARARKEASQGTAGRLRADVEHSARQRAETRNKGGHGDGRVEVSARDCAKADDKQGQKGKVDKSTDSRAYEGGIVEVSQLGIWGLRSDVGGHACPDCNVNKHQGSPALDQSCLPKGW